MIEEQNLTADMRTVVLASELQAAQVENPSQTLEIVTAGQEGTFVRVDTAVNEGMRPGLSLLHQKGHW